MSKEKLTILIKAVADNSKPSGYNFSMWDSNDEITELMFNKTRDRLKKSQYYAITFQLDSQTNAGLSFSKDPSTVFWAKQIPNRTAPCVNSECHLPGIFVDPATPIQDSEIVVINVDRKIELFAFAFNFLRPGDVDGPATNYALYDPIGGNENGGSNLIMENAIVGGLLGLAAGAALGTFVIAPALS